MTISRRRLLQSGAALAAAPVISSAELSLVGDALAQAATEAPWYHALSLFGDVKYAPDFTRFSYVNPDAPKGGVARQISIGTFDSFNVVVAGVKGQFGGAVGLIYETLMTPSQDEVATEYGLLAETVSHPDDHSWVTYRLRKAARWHDGKPVTPEDVIFSFESFKKLSPGRGVYYRHVVKAEKVGDRDIRFTFDAPGNRELPQIMGQLPVLPKHWWEGKDSEGRARDISATTLEKPLGSSPYRVKDFVAGRSITLERVKDYWGEKLPVRIGQNNFDELRYEYFRDTTVSLEAFKADQADWINENSAKNWATSYDFPAATDKRVVREEFKINDLGLMQAFVLNIRREPFKDKRVRRAFNYAFDFEEMNKQLFYGQYTRINSYFEGTELAATGVPEGRQVELLQEVYQHLPPEILARPYENPVGGNPENVRSNLRNAARLLKEAGYEVVDQKLVKDGKPFEVEFLLESPSSERIALFYKPALERLGIGVTIRRVDDAQYENRTRNFDFDIVTTVWGQSLSPGNEQRDFWGSDAADRPGSRNLAGIKHPAVDALIDKIIFAKDRPALIAATKSLDRVLLWNYYVVPQFTYGFARTARWDRFSRFEPMAKYGRSSWPALWWYDSDKAKASRRA